MLAYFDCFSGISGDMTLAAFLDLGAPIDRLKSDLALLPIGSFELTVTSVERHGIQARQCQVIDGGATAIGDGLSTLGRQITSGDDAGSAPADTIGQTLQRIADDAVELDLATDLDRLNFRELPAGTTLAWVKDDDWLRLEAWDEQGEEVAGRYFKLADGEIRTRRPFMPSMFTLDERVIRQDCLGYVMERYPLPGSADA